MQIIEIYKSLQGESSYAGLPCVFVRLAGCNLRCVWCDSEYTFKGGSRMTQEQVESGGASSVARRRAGRDHRRRAHVAGARSGSPDGPACWRRAIPCCWKPAASVRWRMCPREW